MCVIFLGLGLVVYQIHKTSGNLGTVRVKY